MLYIIYFISHHTRYIIEHWRRTGAKATTKKKLKLV